MSYRKISDENKYGIPDEELKVVEQLLKQANDALIEINQEHFDVEGKFIDEHPEHNGAFEYVDSLYVEVRDYLQGDPE